MYLKREKGVYVFILNNRLIKQSENLIVKYNIRSEEFDKLCDKYKSYNVNLNSLIRVKNELQELEKKNKAVDNEISDLRNVLMNLKSKRTVFKESINENKIQMERFNSYKRMTFLKRPIIILQKKNMKMYIFLMNSMNT